MPDFDGGHASIHYSDRGARDTPPVVLLHGLGHDHRAWQPAVAELEAGYRVVSPDLPGHGRSGVSPEPEVYALDRQAADIIALVDHLGFELFALAGWELGGAVALHVARAVHERLAVLVLIDTTPAPSSVTTLPPEYVSLARRFGPRGAARRQTVDRYNSDLQRAALQVAGRATADGFASSLAAWEQAPDLTFELPQIATCPTMVVASEGGPLAEPAFAIASALPAPRVITVSGAAPTAMTTRPDVVASMMHDFLRDVEEGRMLEGSWQV